MNDRKRKKSSIEILQDAITPDVLGVFWLTEDKLLNKPAPFSTLDYFLDGLLTSFYQKRKGLSENREEVSRKNFFISRNFGGPFFVWHLETSHKELKEELKNLMEMAKKMNTAGKRSLLVLNNKQKKDLSFLSKSWPDFNFKFIKLENGSLVEN